MHMEDTHFNDFIEKMNDKKTHFEQNFMSEKINYESFSLCCSKKMVH